MRRARGITRRAFNVLTAGAALGMRQGRCADPDVTLAIVPDTQYMAQFCDVNLQAVPAWICANTNLTVDGAPLNTICAVGNGDCVQDPLSSTESTRAVNAWTQFDTAGLPAVTCPGNHDMGLSASDRDFSTRSTAPGSLLSTAFRTGFFSPASRSAKSYWGGSYDSTGGNTYIIVGRYLIGALEFFPSTGALNWFKGVCLAHPHLNVIVTTHGYMTDTGAVYPRSSGNYSAGTTYAIGACATVVADGWIYESLQDGNIGHPPISSPTWWRQFSPWYDPTFAAADNPDGYAMGQAPLANTGQQILAGSRGHDPNNGGALTTWDGLQLLPNVCLIISGHYVYQPYHTGGGVGPSTPWYWQEQGVTSTSSRAQRMSQFFCNHQQVDNTGGGCPAGSLAAAAVYFLRIKPAAGKIQGYGYSVNASQWIGPAGSLLNPSPVKLFEVDYSPVSNVNRFVISQ